MTSMVDIVYLLGTNYARLSSWAVLASTTSIWWTTPSGLHGCCRVGWTVPVERYFPRSHDNLTSEDQKREYLFGRRYGSTRMSGSKISTKSDISEIIDAPDHRGFESFFLSHSSLPPRSLVVVDVDGWHMVPFYLFLTVGRVTQHYSLKHLCTRFIFDMCHLRNHIYSMCFHRPTCVVIVPQGRKSTISPYDFFFAISNSIKLEIVRYVNRSNL